MPPAHDLVKQCMPDCKSLIKEVTQTNCLWFELAKDPIFPTVISQVAAKKHSIKISFEICSSLFVTWSHKYRIFILAKFVSKMFVRKEN